MSTESKPTANELKARAHELLGTLSESERVELLAMFRLCGVKLSRLPFSPTLRRMCAHWRDHTGREWVEAEMYHCLLAATRRS